MKYITPEVIVYSESMIDEMIGAAACGSKPGSCYGGCNGEGCTFSV